MSWCLIGRVVVVAIRHGGRGRPAQHRIVFPHRWTKAAVLAYVRAEHPGDTVRIVSWPGIGDAPWTWIANPAGFADYRTGRRDSRAGA